MTSCERFLRVFHGQTPDRVPNMEFGYWDVTLKSWKGQGLPERLETDEDVERFLGLEGISIFPRVPLKTDLYPEFREEVIEVRGDRLLVRDEDGNLGEVPAARGSIPRYTRHLIENREDWRRVKSELLDIDDDRRIGDVQAAVAEGRRLGLPVRFNAGSLYGKLRNWMGLEGISIALLTERDWVEEMMEHLTRLTLRVIERGLSGEGVDVAWWWEDMCYNKGPLLSPRLFEDLMVPRYRRITAALKGKHIDLNILDCDGRIYDLVPGWLRAGITCMFPVEAHHTDPLRLREEYGDEILLLGGVNKMSLISGREAIAREVERLEPLVRRGRYIPTVDHRVPPDVTLDNYLYYLDRKSEILQSGRPGLA
jgi:hypothetical protein